MSLGARTIKKAKKRRHTQDEPILFVCRRPHPADTEVTEEKQDDTASTIPSGSDAITSSVISPSTADLTATEAALSSTSPPILHGASDQRLLAVDSKSRDNKAGNRPGNSQAKTANMREIHAKMAGNQPSVKAATCKLTKKAATGKRPSMAVRETAPISTRRLSHTDALHPPTMPLTADYLKAGKPSEDLVPGKKASKAQLPGNQLSREALKELKWRLSPAATPPPSSSLERCRRGAAPAHPYAAVCEMEGLPYEVEGEMEGYAL